MKDPRIEKLPKWARTIIDRLERQVAMLERAERLRQHQDSNSKSKMTALEYRTDVQISLDEFSVCEFRVIDDKGFRRKILANVSEDGRNLVVRGYSASLAVLPEASNTVKVIPA